MISIGIDQYISKIVNLLKGESSHWINHKTLVIGKFVWQDEYEESMRQYGFKNLG
ncbi:MAG: hypothetical protein D4R64_01895 [Porphyromonadaceae bacterium]|nr:MAG: hypothetical protein D4R64_01895 [Porphyromonadaceae bacterium]